MPRPPSKITISVDPETMESDIDVQGDLNPLELTRCLAALLSDMLDEMNEIIVEQFMNSTKGTNDNSGR